MSDLEPGRVQAEPEGGFSPGSRGVEVITEDGMADGLEMEAELMAAAGSWFEFKTSDGQIRIGFGCGQASIEVSDVASAGHPPSSLARFAAFVIDHLERGVIHVLANREFDVPLVRLRMSGDQGVVGLLGLAVLKLATQFSMGFGIERHHDHPAGIPIQSVDDSGARVGVRDPAGETVRLFGADTGHGKEAGRLVQHDQPLIAVNDGRNRVHGALYPKENRGWRTV